MLIRIADLRGNFVVVRKVVLFNGIITLERSLLNPRQISLGQSTKDRAEGEGGWSLRGGQPQISILPCTTLALETHILRVISDFINEFNILSGRQYRFVAGRGHSLLGDLSDILYTTLEHNQFACALFLDVSKAFDSVGHKMLLWKLFNWDYCGQFYSALKSFLTDRSQQVSVGNVCRSKIILKAQVRQGFVLPPLFLSLYVNDLPLFLSGAIIISMKTMRFCNREKA